MIDKQRVRERFGFNVDRQRGLENIVKPYGFFVLEHYNRHGQLITSFPFKNDATNLGKNYLLGTGFVGTPSPITTWYLGLIDATSGTPVIAASDIMTSHAGWLEFAYYNETVRQTWLATAVPLANQVASSAPCSFTVSSGVPSNAFVGGGFVNSDNAKNGTAGTLWATGLFPSAVPVQSGDVFKLNYTVGL